MKRFLIKVQMALLGKCYCASPQPDDGPPMFDLEELSELSMPVPWRRWAQRVADKREQATSQTWTVVKWARS